MAERRSTSIPNSRQQNNPVKSYTGSRNSLDDLYDLTDESKRLK